VFRGFFQLLGIYFPIFFFQLYAIKHGIDRRYAFFSVRQVHLCTEAMIAEPP
jgi:hypothetical protein